MLLLRMHAFEPVEATGNEPVEVKRQPAKAQARASSKARHTEGAKPYKHGDSQPVERANSIREPRKAASGQATPATWQEPNWKALVGKLPVQGAARQLAANCGYQGREGAMVTLVLETGREHLLTEKLQARLAAALSKHFGETLKLRFEVGEPVGETLAQEQVRHKNEVQEKARQAISEDPNVSALMDAFDAEVQLDSIKPVA